jgi:catechol 2,3-dioxygenase-like lactoylglutathione lyase family enzyme
VEPLDFRVTMMHHPSHHVPDLEEADDWLERVFGRPSIPVASVLSQLTVRSDWPRDHAIYTLIGDTFFTTIDPKRFVVGGVQHYPTVAKPHLRDLGWSVDGHADAYRALRREGFRAANSLGEISDGDDPPKGPNDPAPFVTLKEETGLSYQFFPAGRFPGDPRTEPGWVLPAASPDDPLGIERCSHHTILTHRPERARRVYVDALGAEIVHEGRDELRGATSTFLHVGGSTLEYAVPDTGSPAHEEWLAGDPSDTYHAITWKVADLERAEKHLEAQGVGILTRSTDTIVTDPMTSLGIPWGFSSVLVPGDPRDTA